MASCGKNTKEQLLLLAVVSPKLMREGEERFGGKSTG